jgi:hypothetical protein
MRPFKIVKDRGFQCLMKTGRPNYYIPSMQTVSRDVRTVFVSCRRRIAKILQVELNDTFLRQRHNKTHLQKHDGALSFATDAWTSPNHRGYVAVTVHFEENGIPISMLLDLVQVAMSHSGIVLAHVFAKVLDDFGIEDKVSTRQPNHQRVYSPASRFSASPVTMPLVMTP